MDWLSGLIGAGGSILGGILGRNSERDAIRAQNEYNKPSNIRKRAEEAGFNPLLFVGPGVGNQTATGGANFMGAAIADASAMLADKLKDDTADKLAIRNLELQNQRLEKEIAQMTLRPKGAGVYATGVAAQGVRMKPEVVAPKEWEAGFIGPRQPVRVYNPAANKWAGIDAGVADRLGLRDGATVIAEDYEAILGDMGAELVNTPNAVNEAVGGGQVFWDGIKVGPPKPKASDKPDEGGWSFWPTSRGGWSDRP